MDSPKYNELHLKSEADNFMRAINSEVGLHSAKHLQKRYSVCNYLVILPPRFKLQVGVTMVCSGWVNAMFIRNDLPELCTDLVAALSSLNVHELTHGFCRKGEERSQTALRVAGGLQDKRHVSVHLQLFPNDAVNF